MSISAYNNYLINEKSPYLLQHAHNPVDWYPWGDEAFNIAKSEDKPIFLSIGYSTCHWCHVMERESFENEETAGFLNRHFVSIKVDREERPDIDEIYMSVCQALTGSGGWPLSVFLTPEQHPFYAGTYFPPEDRYGMPGFSSLLQGIADAWDNNRQKLMDSGNKIIEALSRREPPAGMPSEDIIQQAIKSYRTSFDRDFGGFGQAPKFPSPHNLLFLLRCYAALGDGNALEMTLSTLRAMETGGIYDHIGGGFCRYSTDRKWLAPHFEKMLYDNALLSMAYGEAWQVIKDESFACTARDTLDYVLREMTDENGGFYSAEDADSEGVEGKFYLWAKEEVLAVLGQEDGTRYCQLYDITQRGNFEGKNIPNLIGRTLSEEERTFVETCAKRLFDVRNKRVHPHKDDKILTSWNALMIAALALCGKVLGETQYVTAAKKAIVFLLSTLVRQDGRLLARYRQGEAKYPGYADDYVFLIWALLELYDTTFDSSYLQKAVSFAEDAMRLFWDEEHGGLYLYGSDSEQLVMRPKNAYDGAIPSANSVFAMDCLRLSGLTGDPRWEKTAYELFRTFGGNVNEQPAAHSHLLTAYLYGQTEKADVVIVCPEDGNPDDFLSRLRSDYRPFVHILVLWEDDEILLNTASFLKDYHPIEGKHTAYVCTGGSCRAPVTDAEKMMDELNKLHKLKKT